MAGTTFFISSRIRFRSKIVMTSIAISYLVMIIAVSVSSGFRQEVRDGLTDICGDVQLTSLTVNVMDEANPIPAKPSYIDDILAVDGVEEIVPAVYRAGIIKGEEDIQGVIFKGVPAVEDSVALGVSIPRRLAEIGGFQVGDKVLSYFVGEKVKLRRFNVTSIYDPMLQTDDKLLVYASLDDMQRLNGWSENEVSALEIKMKPSNKDKYDISEATAEIGAIAYEKSLDEDGTVVAMSSMDRYSTLYDWLDLIDFNVLFILILMTIVAGFNMISGLLILLFENISTIGMFKAIGMTDKAIAKVFLASSSSLVLKGMLGGNVLAILFCLIQSHTHLLKLNPENYFVSFVPVHIDWTFIAFADIVSFVVISLFMLIPCVFITKVDPAESVRVK